MCRRWSKHRPAVRAELGSYAPQRLAFAEILKDNWAANVLAQVTDATTVITTNYDNLAERILSCRPGLTHQREGTNCPHCRMCRLLLAYHSKIQAGPDSAPMWVPFGRPERGMNLRIQAAVARHESLTLKVNQGERHRITKRSLRGSLWITPLVGRFKLHLTGDVGPELHASVTARHGPKAGQDQGRSYWYIDRVDDVEALIQTLGKRGPM